MSEPDISGSKAWLWQRASLCPTAPALFFDGAEIGLGELAERAGDLAGRLRALGVGPGDRVALLLDPCVRLVELIHGLQFLGAGALLLNTRLTRTELSRQLNRTRPTLLVHGREHTATVTEPGMQVDGLKAVEAVAELDAVSAGKWQAQAGDGSIGPGAVHSILFTSGSTEEPKAVMLTNDNHFASALASRANLGRIDEDKWLNLLPLYHVGGLSILLRSVIDGVPVLLQERFDAAEANRAIFEDGVTLLSLVPTMLEKMLAQCPRPHYPPSLRAVLVGGAALDKKLLMRAQRARMPVLASYGLTEAASQVATVPPAVDGVPEDSVGRPLAGVELAIDGADAHGKGEIMIRGANVMAGYLDEPRRGRGGAATWFKTGDIGRIDEHGFLYLHGRKGELIISGGENVSPMEVEAALLAHPLVAEAAVYPVDDDTWGQTVACALVVCAGGKLGESDIDQSCRRRLAGYKVPRRVRFVDALPRTPLGKLDRSALKKIG